jgi:predicted unusual protein kinase regulating ubiquinone biosynthesis (AarF/ABC1/UbiB family)
MGTARHLHEAYAKAFGHSPSETAGAATLAESAEIGKAALYLESLQDIRREVGPPEKPDIAEDMAFALLNTGAPLEQRRMHANRALDSAKKGIITHTPEFAGVNLQEASEQADDLSNKFVSGVVEVAASYPQKTDVKPLADNLLGLIGQEERSPQDTAVAVMAVGQILQPYIVERLLTLNPYDPSGFRRQIALLKSDTGLMIKFYDSISHAVEFSVTGKTSISDAEVADKLFNIGPMFVQLGQSFTAAAHKAGGDEKSKEFIMNVGKAMQEGVAMPDEAQRQKLASELPEGLELDEFFSSAKIAYVAKTHAPEGTFATKVMRPGVEQSISDNARMFTVMSEALAAYVEAHAGQTTLANKVSIAKDVLPFGLAVLESNMRKETDFILEAQRQKRGAKLFGGHKGILVPGVVDKYSNATHITMDLVPGERIEKVPAHRGYLKNTMILFLQGRKGRFFHGDMHGGNVKAATEVGAGVIVAYDWGKSFEMPKRFEANLLRFIIGTARKNPKAIAKAYSRIQSPEHNQASIEEVETVTNEVIQATSPADGPKQKWKGSRVARRLQETRELLSNISTAIAIKHQSIMDFRYASYMSSTMGLATIFANELAKPEYIGRRYKTMAVLRAAAGAIKDVYFKKRR